VTNDLIGISNSFRHDITSHCMDESDGYDIDIKVWIQNSAPNFSIIQEINANSLPTLWCL
jgi:hypothetical protein